MEQISNDVAKFTKGCECLLSVLAQHAEFSETEQNLISYYCQQIMVHTQNLRAESTWGG
jgi:hypothetical protein